ncbi:UDP-N-acetylglucosamine--N-acetylmuramyl-(pentapeptide) pyrophosphoryl-undecaprenol N-acetylglucosamine transferase [Candidatus Woesebacteria bacterium]|nr:UDP-N-acetylglucosamine--N-acetylmuramyl-(pentapeptide) pyrophosphoryl-undecaprenol N-acetylglucosamine transferase [Candidatus Woesebacteria bacterium]MCD8506794.1 UDP-N-acetylglucosamine--N-acetylmuramyl-(pentapeptide) pyrophosphoryl-undecaprenol N-acetylglucosamine transferase [Candidatus Woesebacteria bacterium]MCD8527703.1 UDP-N-acetylglucosamine--N-acetylmuramyl-(pentapeptide) pyrophosphoryl-undecaprenol N-acetylglucosamine transferase [Candidatus Woesebacteria bacterium]MCD8546328.1 UD
MSAAPKTSPWPNILVSGGHITPALATIEYLREEYPEISLSFVGRKFTQEKERQPAKEQELMTELGIPFFAASAAKFHRAHWWRNAEEGIRFVPSLYRAYRILQDNDIDLFLSFGGYLAVPFAIMAKLTGKKVVTHEQTKTTGLANQFISWIADTVAISHEASRKHFPKQKIVLTGNPIRRSLLQTVRSRPAWIPESKKPILYVTGGSQGSQTINNTVSQILPELTSKFLVIHQCGQSQHHRYMSQLQAVADELTEAQRENYVIREWVEEKEVSWILQNAVLAISRSGANTTLEMSIQALPAIFIPLPFSHNNEQYKNAQQLVEAGAALLLEQKDLNDESLWEAVQEASAQRAHMKRRAEKLRDTLQTNGAELLAEACISLLRS